jgi:hypothetical protein
MSAFFFFAADISDVVRPMAIDGSRKLIARGEHREAIFWMVASYSRCQKVFHYDAPLPIQEQFGHGYQELLADLGIASFTDLQRRRDQIRHALPMGWQVAEAIIAANRAIDGSSHAVPVLLRLRLSALLATHGSRYRVMGQLEVAGPPQPA